MNHVTAAERLKQHGIRATRFHISLLTLLQQSSAPLDAVRITEESGVNKSTVYRAISLFTKSGLVHEVNFDDGKMRYEITQLHHHHLICVKCNSVADYQEENDLHHQEQIIREKNHFQVLRHNLEFFGICQKCNP